MAPMRRTTKEPGVAVAETTFMPVGARPSSRGCRGRASFRRCRACAVRCGTIHLDTGAALSQP